MEVVIEIDDEEYKKLMNEKDFIERVAKNPLKIAIVNGTPLPKGHGRLIDADETLAIAWQNFYKHEDEWAKKDEDFLLIHRFYDQLGFECCQQTIVNAPTIIEAEKGAEK